MAQNSRGEILILVKITNVIIDHKLERLFEYGVPFRRIIHMCHYFKYLNQKLPEFENSNLLIEICKVPKVFKKRRLRKKINKYSYQIFNLLLKSGHMANFVDDYQRTAIYYLLSNYDGTRIRKKMIKQLINEGSADLEQIDAEALTPLVYVCYIKGQTTNKRRHRYFPIHEVVDLVLKYKNAQVCQKELRMALHYLQTNSFLKAKYITEAIRKIHLALELV